MEPNCAPAFGRLGTAVALRAGLACVRWKCHGLGAVRDFLAGWALYSFGDSIDNKQRLGCPVAIGTGLRLAEDLAARLVEVGDPCRRQEAPVDV